MAIDSDDDERGAKTEAAVSEKKPMLLIVLVVVEALLIVGAVALYFLVLKPPEGGAKEKVGKDAITSEDSVDAEGEGFAEEEPLEGERPLGLIMPLDTFVVNLQDSGFLKVTIQLEFVERDVPRQFFSRQVLVRDGVITLLSSKKREPLLTIQGKDSLRDELKELVNAALKNEAVEKVYFTDFVVR